MKKAILTLLVLANLFVGWNIYNDQLPFGFPVGAALGINNGCLVESTLFAQQYRAYMVMKNADMFSKILFLRLAEKDTENVYIIGHAVCFFRYDNRSYIYDPNYGSYLLHDYNPYKSQLSELKDLLLVPDGIEVIDIAVYAD